MKLRIITSALLLLLGTLNLHLSAQNTHPGSYLAEEKDGVHHFEVRLVTLDNDNDGLRLKNGLEAKEGIVSAEVEVTERLVKITVKPPVGTALLRESIEFHGFSIAKKFEL